MSMVPHNLPPVPAPTADTSGAYGVEGLQAQLASAVPAPMADTSGPDGMEVLQAQLASADGEGQDQNDEINQHIDNADVMLKLLLMCGVPGVPPGDCDDFTSLVCRLICGGVAEDYGNGTSDAATFREYVDGVCNVLDAAINPRAIDEKGMLHSNLNIAMADMMRTSTFCLLSGDIEARKEYTRDRRSPENQKKGELWRIIRSPRITPENRMAYATAEAMTENFDDGVQALKALKDRNEEELLEFVNTSIPHLVRNLECMAFPILFDGQRLRAGITIAAKLFGEEELDYGVDFMARHVLNANASAISLFRLQATFCAFLAMARVYIIGVKDDGWMELMYIIDDFVTEMDNELKSKLKEEGSRRDAPGSITAAFACIATWFEMAVHDDNAYRVVQSAFQSPVLVLGEACSKLTRCWQAFRQENQVPDAVNLWTAVQFLVTARKEMYGTSMPISTAVHIVLSGLVGNCVTADDIPGPFILCHSCKEFAAVYYKKLPKVKFTLPEYESYDAEGRVKSPTRDGSRECKETQIIKTILDKGRVRGQHEKGRLVETRLAASLPFLSIKEALMRDLPKGVSASTSEGRKDLRRLHIKYLQTLPGSKHAWCLHLDQGSYLIERKRTGDDGRTTSDNVEKPWRDILGGSLISTLYHPLAGEAFMLTLEDIVDGYGKFESNTNACVEVFASKMEQVANIVFDPAHALYGAPDHLEGREHAHRIFSQQRALVKAVCEIIRTQTGALWEAMQLTFSMHAAKTDDDEINSGSTSGGGLPPLPPMAALPELPRLPPLPERQDHEGVARAHAVPLGPVVVGRPVLPEGEKRSAGEAPVQMSRKQQKAPMVDPGSPSLTFHGISLPVDDDFGEAPVQMSRKQQKAPMVDPGSPSLTCTFHGISLPVDDDFD
jgi:hypothetical protein